MIFLPGNPADTEFSSRHASACRTGTEQRGPDLKDSDRAAASIQQCEGQCPVSDWRTAIQPGSLCRSKITLVTRVADLISSTNNEIRYVWICVAIAEEILTVLKSEPGRGPTRKVERVNYYDIFVERHRQNGVVHFVETD